MKVDTDEKTKRDDATLRRAMRIMEDRAAKYGVLDAALTDPGMAKDYVRLKLAEQEREVFACLFLDNRHRLLKYDELFYGTIDGANVYPREVAKAALLNNAAAVIFTHNHPSGVPEPSEADKAITKRLTAALELFDIRALDHIVVGGNDTVSFAERGLI